MKEIRVIKNSGINRSEIKYMRNKAAKIGSWAYTRGVLRFPSQNCVQQEKKQSL